MFAYCVRGLLCAAVVGIASTSQAVQIQGDYLESRSCDIYTGPCFANAELGLTGRQAVMAWSIDSGKYQGVDLGGLKVVVAVRSVDTLGFGVGITVRNNLNKSVILIDNRANTDQQAALEKFAREKAGATLGEVVRVTAMPIDMKLDHIDMTAKLKAGKEVAMETRKLGKSDCVCSNEQIYYPPLTDVENAEPAFTMESSFQGRSLGSKWDHTRGRSSFLATFAY